MFGSAAHYDAVPNAQGGWGGGIEYTEDKQMRADIHPAYSDVKVTCSCGAVYETRSTKGEDFTVDVCQECHPFTPGTEGARHWSY